MLPFLELAYPSNQIDSSINSNHIIRLVNLNDRPYCLQGNLVKRHAPVAIYLLKE